MTKTNWFRIVCPGGVPTRYRKIVKEAVQRAKDAGKPTYPSITEDDLIALQYSVLLFPTAVLQ